MRKITFALVGVALLVSGYLLAQALPQGPSRITTTTDGQIVAIQGGDSPAVNGDVAVRIEGTHDGRVLGTLVVKVNGKWTEVLLASKNMRAARR